MDGTAQNARTRILILATLSGGYAGADTVGQMRLGYPCHTYILPVRDPAMFPEWFYLQAFERGMDAILVMFSGTDNPYRGGSERVAALINKIYPLMKQRGIDPRRLRLVAICTVCSKAFLKEVNQMSELLREIGPVRQELSAVAPDPLPHPTPIAEGHS
jgi:coenzyme F420-reducing hydrogenase delta subunit